MAIIDLSIRFALCLSLSAGLAVPALAQTANPVPDRQQTARDAGAVVVHTQPAGSAEADSPVAEALRQVSAEARQFQQHVTTLSDPFFEGRVPGSRGNRIAAEYIEHHFAKAGLQPAFPASASNPGTQGPSFRQAFRAGSTTQVLEQQVQWTGPRGGSLTPEADFTVLGLSGSGEATAPVVFAGYAIDEGPGGYRGLADNADLSGKIAMIFRFEPMNASGQSLWSQGQGWSPAASLDAKIDAVLRRGASGVILVNPPGAADPRAARLISASDSLPFRERAKVPVVMLSTDAAERLLAGTGRTLMDLRALADRPEGKLEPLAVGPDAVTIRARIETTPIMTDNIGAVLPGRGTLADEWVIIGAHYDHVGYGPVGTQPQYLGQLHPGADDNASGTTGLIMLAGMLAADAKAAPPDQPRRSILFLAFCAEESGLNGSRFYVNNPPPNIPNERVALMINLDMIGRLRNNTLEVMGTQTGAGLMEMLSPIFDASGLIVRHGSSVASNSDHAPFFGKGIPVLFFFTGLHREYHTPRDTHDTINAVGGARVVDLVRQTANAAATRPQRFEFQRPAQQAQASPGPMRTRVRFGIAPGTYSDDRPGIEIGDVYENTPAAEAGLKVGDRLIKWNGAEVRKVEDWMPMLSAHNPGDVVDVTILREGKELTVKVTLRGRDSTNR